jgi:quercetin dioxygenase-like cupin family protein
MEEQGALSEQDVLVGPDEGEMITDRENREVALIAVRHDITISRSRYGPGERGPDPHVHREHTDSFFVLDGELTFALGPDGERVVVPAGGFVAVPPNVSHSFGNEGGADARFLNLHSPDGGFAAFMRGARDGADMGFDSFDPPPDGGRPASAAIVVGPDQGDRVVAGNRVAVVKAVHPHICFLEFDYDGPRDGPAVHDHDDQVDSFYVLEGEIEFTVEDSVHLRGPGTLASIPRGVRHTFRHVHDGRGRVLNIHAPDCGFGEFIRGTAD